MCLKIEKIHHFAIICSDYEKSKYFYTKVLPFSIIAEHYREERHSFKLDLSLNGNYILELCSFPNPAKRPSYPEACGGRHLCLGVSDIKETISFLQKKNIAFQPLRTDEYTGKQFTFIEDPDGFPIELYEC